MAIRVAEYLGVNVATGNPTPYVQGTPIPPCPFNGLPCSKIVRKEKPTCSGWDDEQHWIICQDRLVSAVEKAQTTHAYLAPRLREIAQILWPNNLATDGQIAVARQFNVLDSEADYVFALNAGWQIIPLPLRYIVEIQGGGTTGQTTHITNLVNSWEQGVPGVSLDTQVRSSPDPYGVWKRLLVQVFTKGIAAVNARQGIGCVVGERFGNWIENKFHLSRLKPPHDGYVDFVIIPYKVLDRNSSPVTLVPDQDKIIRSTLKQFTDMLLTSEDAARFPGKYMDLTGNIVNSP